MTPILQELYNRAVFTLARLRARFWGLFLKSLGHDVLVMKGILIASPGRVEVGSNTNLMQNVIIGGEGGVKIGSFVMISSDCRIMTSNHGYEDFHTPMCQQELVKGPVVIEDDVWLGAHVVVLPNVRIGRGAIVAANSLVTKDVAPFSIVCGVPARLIKYRFDPEHIPQAAQVQFRY